MWSRQAALWRTQRDVSSRYPVGKSDLVRFALHSKVKFSELGDVTIEFPPSMSQSPSAVHSCCGHRVFFSFATVLLPLTYSWVGSGNVHFQPPTGGNNQTPRSLLCIGQQLDGSRLVVFGINFTKRLVLQIRT